jgi:hypothetical protein
MNFPPSIGTHQVTQQSKTAGGLQQPLQQCKAAATRTQSHASRVSQHHFKKKPAGSRSQNVLQENQESNGSQHPGQADSGTQLPLKKNLVGSGLQHVPLQPSQNAVGSQSIPPQSTTAIGAQSLTRKSSMPFGAHHMPKHSTTETEAQQLLRQSSTPMGAQYIPQQSTMALGAQHLTQQISTAIGTQHLLQQVMAASGSQPIENGMGVQHLTQHCSTATGVEHKPQPVTVASGSQHLLQQILAACGSQQPPQQCPTSGVSRNISVRYGSKFCLISWTHLYGYCLYRSFAFVCIIFGFIVRIGLIKSVETDNIFQLFVVLFV